MGGFGGTGGLVNGNRGQLQGTASNVGITIKVEGTAVMAGISAVVNKKAAPAQLITAEEAARILREVPEPPSTTREDLVRQQLEALGLGAAMPSAAMPSAPIPSTSPSMPAGVVTGIPVEASNMAPEKPMMAAEPAQKDWKQELKELKELLDSGVLTQDEFNNEKKKILERNQ